MKTVFNISCHIKFYSNSFLCFERLFHAGLLWIVDLFGTEREREKERMLYSGIHLPKYLLPGKKPASIIKKFSSGNSFFIINPLTLN